MLDTFGHFLEPAGPPRLKHHGDRPKVHLAFCGRGSQAALSVVVRIEITAREALQFLENLQEVIDRPPREWLYLMNPGRDGLPISFDHEWYPFLGKGYGFNPEGKR